MKILYKITFLFFAITFCQVSITQSQMSDVHTFNYWLNELNASYTPPLGFRPHGGFYSYQPAEKSILSGQLHSIINTKENIIISIEVNPVREGATNQLSRKAIDSISNSSYLRSQMRNQSLTMASGKPEITQKMIEDLHASQAIIYLLKVDRPYREGYKFIKTVCLHRTDIGQINLNFIARDKNSEAMIDKMIEKTWGLIRFKEDKYFNPTLLKEVLIGKFIDKRPPISSTKALKNAAESKNLSLLVLQLNANKYLAAKEYENAIDCYLKIITLDPVNKIIYEKIASSYKYLNQTDSSFKYAKKGYFIDSTNTTTKLIMADYYANNNQLDSAIILYKKCLFIPNTGAYLAQSKEKSDIIINSSEVNNISIYLCLGKAYLAKDNEIKAIEMLNNSNKTSSKWYNKRYPQTDFVLGITYLKLDKKNNSTKYMEKAKESIMNAKNEGYPIPKDIELKLGI